MNRLRPLSPHLVRKILQPWFIPFLLIVIFFSLFSFAIGFDFHLLCNKLESLFLRKGLSFLLQRVGWEVGIFFALIYALSDGEATPPPGNLMVPGGSGTSSWKEDSFDIDVLLEEDSSATEPSISSDFPAQPMPPSSRETPDPQAHHPGTAAPEASAAHPDISRNRSLEASLCNRVRALEEKDSVFVRWGNKGDYWNLVETNLQSQSTKMEYYLQLDFESQDLQLRELRDQAADLVKNELNGNPEILNGSCETNPDEALLDFFNEKTEKIAASYGNCRDFRMRDRMEMEQLNTMIQDLKQKGSASSTFHSIVRACFPPIYLE
eukprot:TRINITY_DN10733_c0_g2_i1.p1 TRINITY_DN10733_c0_g2~~TRINITY_DN10733_c0_g2_i1.p1  ORF type:complete len:322 (+),score=22.23 TRINITY_DN10733_c0_g2_i1:27-992(+)